MRIRDDTLERWLSEDVPYIDLTTRLRDIGHRAGRSAYFRRGRTVVCGSEEVRGMFDKVGMTAGVAVPSGTLLESSQLAIEGFGPAEALHEAWKVCPNILEYGSGITRANAAEYAATGVDAIATGWVYFGKPADIRAVMEVCGADE